MNRIHLIGMLVDIQSIPEMASMPADEYFFLLNDVTDIPLEEVFETVAFEAKKALDEDRADFGTKLNRLINTL